MSSLRKSFSQAYIRIYERQNDKKNRYTNDHMSIIFLIEKYNLGVFYSYTQKLKVQEEHMQQ